VQQSPRERVFNLPAVILLLVAFMGALHAVRVYLLSPEEDISLITMLAFVPARITAQFDAVGVAAAFRQLALKGGDDFEFARFFFGDGSPQPWTVLTYSFLHADWAHFGLNSVWLAAFGAPVARRFGPLRFLTLFIMTALAGAAAHYLFHRFDAAPVIGASAAVSGAMAAAIRFVFQPGAPLGQSLSYDEDERVAYRQPALPLMQVLKDRRALTFLIFWFVTNLIFGVAAQPLGLSESGIAWEAHVGGFLAGLLLFSWFDPKHPPAIYDAPLEPDEDIVERRT
jgi:membrane associated rhomboid family serine protease